MGYRGRSGKIYPGYGPFRGLSQWGKPGRIYGRGIRVAYSINPYLCRRFPTLPRFWWTDPNYKYFIPSSNIDESKIIKQELATIQSHLNALKNRLEEINKDNEKEFGVEDK